MQFVTVKESAEIAEDAAETDDRRCKRALDSVGACLKLLPPSPVDPLGHLLGRDAAPQVRGDGIL